MISRKPHSDKMNLEKFNQQIFFEVENGHTVIIEAPRD